MARKKVNGNQEGVACPVCATESGLEPEERGILESCPSCKKALFCRSCGECLKCGVAPAEKAERRSERAEHRLNPEVDPRWGHNKPTGGIRYTPLKVPVRRMVTIKGKKYVVSLLPLTHEIEFRPFRTQVRYRYSLEGVLLAAARQMGEKGMEL